MLLPGNCASSPTTSAANTPASRAMSELPPCRTAEGVTVVSGAPDYKILDKFGTSPSGVRKVAYSPNGEFFGWCSTEGVKIFDAETGELVRELPTKTVLELEFSPKGNYVILFDRFIKSDDPNKPHKNLEIHDTRTGALLTSFTQKTLTKTWAPQWTESESLFARMVTNEIQFFSPANPEQPAHKLRLEGLTQFQLSPGNNPHVAAFVPEKKGAPAHVYLYSVPAFSSPVAFKSFFKADNIQFFWNSFGTNVLVLTSTDVDTTNKSYYGETNLYYLSVSGAFDCRVELDKPGPVHDVAWIPDLTQSGRKNFIVVYGSMPSKAVMFDHRAAKVIEFSPSMRNTAVPSPQGRFLIIAGFGNLAGDMDVYDLATNKLLTTIQSANSSVCMWTPCGRYIMTAICTPRLRVDNGYKVFHYTGAMVYKHEFKELYGISLRPASIPWPAKRALSPPPANAILADKQAKPVGKYRPPGARGTDSPSWARRDAPQPDALTKNKAGERTVPGMASKKANGGTVSPTSTTSSNSGTVTVIAGSKDPAKEREKKIKNLIKKLKGIQEIKAKRERGETLELNQMEKLEKEKSIRAELEDLKRDGGVL